MSRIEATLRELLRWDRALCVQLNGALRYEPLLRAFRALSWLGNGIFWYALMLGLLVLHKGEAVLPVLHMAFVGAVCTASYKMLKRSTVRNRPYQVNPQVLPGASVLDHFSFPSGHTLHAIAFSVVACFYYPALWIVLWPFTLLTAVSRVALGLHYPSDVVAGGALGALIAGTSFLIA